VTVEEPEELVELVAYIDELLMMGIGVRGDVVDSRAAHLMWTARQVVQR
jgi:hypothetical protein